MDEPIDDFAQRIMERTRERREMLAKKMADTSPRRKRSSPRSINSLQNITNTPREFDSHDGPSKRTCVRDAERSVHDDTPAVRGVKSRLNTLAETRKHWLNGDGEQMETDTLPAQPRFDDLENDENQAISSPRPDRKNRLAALAKDISSWEDDLSHPVIKQEEKPKKKVWQRPAVADSTESALGKPASRAAEVETGLPSKPPRTYEYDKSPARASATRPFVSPNRKPLEDALSPPKAKPGGQKAVSSITVTLSGVNSAVRDPSPYRSTSSSNMTREPSPYRNSSSRLREPSPARDITQRSVSPGRSGRSEIRSASPGQARAVSPARATFGNAVPRPYVSPNAKLKTTPSKTGFTHVEPVKEAANQKASGPVNEIAPRRSDIYEPTKKPVSDRMQAWRARTDGAPAQTRQNAEPQKKQLSAMERLKPRVGGGAASVLDQSALPEDDPLNMSLHSRLNVWETKIHRTEQEKEEDARLERELIAKKHQSRGAPSAVRAPSPARSPASVRALSPARSSASVRAPSPARAPASVRAPSPARAQGDPNTYNSTSSVGSKSPVLSRSPGHTSPSKVGQATKALHERLNAFANNWQQNEIAEKIRQQKEKDMEVLTNRWKSGVHASSTDDVSQPTAASNKQAVETIPQESSSSGIPAAPPTPPPPSVDSKTRHDPQSLESSCSGIPAAPPPPAPASVDSQSLTRPPISSQREVARDVMRKVLPNGGGDYRTSKPAPQNFEEKLQQMGFAVESSDTHKATCDLTPYRERDRQAKQQQAAEQSSAAKPPKKPVTVRVEDTRITEVKFEESQRDTIIKKQASTVTSSVCFTPSKPSTAYAQHNAAGKTPSIYSLIKKTGGPTPYRPNAGTTTPDALKIKPTPGRKDSFSDDSFDEQMQDDSAEPCVPVKRTMDFGTTGQCGGSQSSLASDTTSQYSETQTDTQNDSYTETEVTEATNTESSEDESEYTDEDEEGGNVSSLLDEALDEDEEIEQQQLPAAHIHQQQRQHYEKRQQQQHAAMSPQPVPRRSKHSNPAARPPRPQTLPPQDSDIESTASSQDYYNTRAQRCSAPSSKRVKFASPGGGRVASPAASGQSRGRNGSRSQSSSSASESDDRPYSIDLYRRSKSKMNAPVPKMTIVRHSNSHQMEMAKQDPLPYTPTKTAKERLTELQERVNQEQSVIMQTSNALNQCCGTNSSFAGSQEAVECHKLLLIACKKREAYIGEMHKLRQGWDKEPRLGPQGSLTISDIRLPLKQNFMQNIGGPHDLAQHYFLLLVRHGDHVVFTQMVGTHDAMVKGTLDIPNMIKFSDISQDFRLEVEVYGMLVTREDPNAKHKKKKGLTPKKVKGGGLGRSVLASPGGPTAVRSTNFVLVGHMLLDAAALNKTHFTLDGVPFSSPLHGTVHLRLRCVIESSVVERGFLTIFEDVSGFGAWHRRWFVLKDTQLAYWKYPDDEKYKEPMGWMEMKQVVTDTVGLIPRDICARPNTFELITVRRQNRGESDTLTSRCYNTMTTTKHWLSADTKEERILWCNRLNEALTNIRTWHSDALRPIKQQDFVQPYNPYPGKNDQRSCIIPFNPHDQQSAV